MTNAMMAIVLAPISHSEKLEDEEDEVAEAKLSRTLSCAIFPAMDEPALTILSANLSAIFLLIVVMCVLLTETYYFMTKVCGKA